MQSVSLTKGRCAICRKPIPKDWTNRPRLGDTCRECFDRHHTVFGPANVKLKVQRRETFDPLFGVHDYHFDWKGTRVTVNGKVGTVTQTYANGCYVQFTKKRSDPGEFIVNLGYWDLRRIYGEAGGQLEPPALQLPELPLRPVKLRDEPFLPIVIHKGSNGSIRGIEVDDGEGAGGIRIVSFGHRTPMRVILSKLHAFANLFVRYRFGLAPNFCCEGGFLGKDFEVRNLMFGCGLTVRGGMDEQLAAIQSPKDALTYAFACSLVGTMIDREKARAGVSADPSAANVLTAWFTVMHTLLRHDWSGVRLDSIERVWWFHHEMQCVLLTILSPDDLQGALAYAKKGRMDHAGSPY